MEKNEGWLDRNLRDPEFERLYERELVADDFVAQLEDAMDGIGMRPADLARKLNRKPSAISRSLRTSTNMTLGTMVDMGLAVGKRIHLSFVDARPSTSEQPVLKLISSSAGCKPKKWDSSQQPSEDAAA